INRWDLQKLDPAAKVSPPKNAIIFHMEKTVPVNLRPIVRAGIEEWNKAFDKLGFDNAVEVRQQRDEDTWDPEDVNYNTFRWITAEAGFAMGPSRVNPLTGQILDADIIFDASFLRSWKTSYENFTPSAVAALLDLEQPIPTKGPALFGSRRHHHADCRLNEGMQHQSSLAGAVFAAQGLTAKRGELPDEYLQQALKEVVMHEVGHTLGLRHNFRASAWKTLAEMDDPAKANEPTVGSVMDYLPVNIVPAGTKQPVYYTTTLGPYDHWAIEYGYKTVAGDENAELAKIAMRSGESGLDYSTDEDTETNDPDPLSNRFDLSKDPIAHAQRQMALVNSLLPKLLERTVENGEGYQRARQAFGVLIGEYYKSAQFVARFIGGVMVHRDHKGDNQARPPFKTVDAAQQRAAMKQLAEQAFHAPKYDPASLNSLSSTNWRHWGVPRSSLDRAEYPIHKTISDFQEAILGRTLNHLTLSRIQDGEAKAAAGEDVYTLPEHLKSVIESVFSELTAPPAGEFNNRTPYISSFRRALQRTALKRFADIVAKPRQGQPEDARVLTRMYLNELAAKIDAALGKGDLKLDDYTRAHLTDSRLRIKQVLEAETEDFGKPAGGGGGGFFIFGAEAEPRTRNLEAIAPEQP
ncbi:MAG: zinc-dependent metalloprotease, partial [Candidatus Saccharimonas sp.]|nr:zinc-dependent metalloprotease [Planctomycetaceae bacterium]